MNSRSRKPQENTPSAQDILSASAALEEEILDLASDDLPMDPELPAPAPVFSAASHGMSTVAPPSSPPPLDDMVQSAGPPRVEEPMASPPPLDELQQDPSGSAQMEGGSAVALRGKIIDETDDIGGDSPIVVRRLPAADGATQESASNPVAPAASLQLGEHPTSSAIQAEHSMIVQAGSIQSMNVKDAEETPSRMVISNKDADSAFALRPRGLPAPGTGSRSSVLLYKILGGYSELVVRRPCFLIAFYIILLAAVIGVAWKPLNVDTDFSSFIRADGESMRRRDAYTEALGVKKKQQSGRRLLASAGERPPVDDVEGMAEWREIGKGKNSQRRLRPDVVVTSEEDVRLLEEAHAEGHGRQLLGGGGVIALLRTMTLTYLPDDGNAFDQRFLKEVRDFEHKLRTMPAWKDMCGNKVHPNHQAICDPGETFIAYAYPSKHAPITVESNMVNATRYKFSFDANGADQLQIPAALAVLQQSTATMHDLRRFFPKAYSAPAIGTDVKGAAPPIGFRTKYTFYLVIGEAGMPLSQMRANTGTLVSYYENFIKDEVYPFMVSASIDKARILYQGDVLTGHEVSHTLFLDARYALCSMVFVTLYLWFHTGSIMLATCSMGIIFTSIPLAYVLTPASKTTVASFLSLFLVTGIGCDVVFVFIDCWAQSAEVEQPEARSRRITWTLLHAGRNCLATSLTTAGSFFANLASALQPLREFGVFMGLCVFGAFFLVTLLLPPLIILRENSCGRRVIAVVPLEADLSSTAIVPAAPLAAAQPKAATGRRKTPIAGRALMGLTNKIADCPCVVAIGTGVCVLIFMVGVFAKVELDRDIPDLFPEGHNQVEEAKAQGLFSVIKKVSTFDILPTTGVACHPDAKMANWGAFTTKETCTLHWCETPYAAPSDSSANNSLTCWWQKGPLPACRTVEFRIRMAASAPPSGNSWSNGIKDAVLKRAPQPAPGGNLSWATYTPDTSELNTLVIENWETGGTSTSRFYSMGKVNGYFPSQPVAQWNSTCSVSTICFQGENQCSLPGYVRMGTFNGSFPLPGGRLLQERPTANQSPMLPGTSEDNLQLVAASADGHVLQPHPVASRSLVGLVPTAKRVDVTVIWGVRAARSTPILGAPAEVWSFDPTFEPGNPWAQRAMLAMCDPANLPADLLVITQDTKCWIEKFKAYMSYPGSGKRFPARGNVFNTEVDQWFGTTIQGAENLWRKGTKVQAAKLTFILNLANDNAAQVLLERRTKWDDYLAAMNKGASVTANQAFHTASAWVRAEAEIAVVDSTIDTIIVSAVCAWVGMLFFTQDPVLSCLVLALVLGTILGLAFFIVCMMGWMIGSIEVISLVIFVGYSVTYSLHVAHTYAEAHLPTQGQDGDEEAPLAEGMLSEQGGPPLSAADARKLRTKMAIAHIGTSVLSSAISTIGSSIFLLFCTMVIFVKLGAVLLTVTFLSIVCALVALPALLMLVGPPPEPFHRRVMRCLHRTKARLKGRKKE